MSRVEYGGSEDVDWRMDTSTVDDVLRQIRLESVERMIIEHVFDRSSKSNRIIERTIQHVQGMIRTIRRAIEEKWKVKIDVTHIIRPWIAEQTR